jgi:hypothetical protein
MDAPVFPRSSVSYFAVPAWAALQNSRKNILELWKGQEAASIQIVLSAILLNQSFSTWMTEDKSCRRACRNCPAENHSAQRPVQSQRLMRRPRARRHSGNA